MGTARRWKRKQSRAAGEYISSIGISHYYERGNVEVVVHNDLDGTAVAWQCRLCEAFGSVLLPVGAEEALAEHEFFTGFLQEHERCERQPEANLPKEVAEAFDALRNGFETGLQNGRRHAPIALLLGTKIGVAWPHSQDDAGKQLSFSLFRAGCRSALAANTDSPGVAIGFEAWMNSAGTGPFAWLTPKEAATRLRVSLRSFQEWDVPAHELPGNGRKGQPIKRYRTVDVDQWASRYFAGNGTLQAVG